MVTKQSVMEIGQFRKLSEAVPDTARLVVVQDYGYREENGKFTTDTGQVVTGGFRYFNGGWRSEVRGRSIPIYSFTKDAIWYESLLKPT